jgi:hypothetical protein
MQMYTGMQRRRLPAAMATSTRSLMTTGMPSGRQNCTAAAAAVAHEWQLTQQQHITTAQEGVETCSKAERSTQNF